MIPQLTERHDPLFLPFSPDIAHRAADPVRLHISAVQEHVTGPPQMLRPPLAGRIVQTDREVAHRRRLQPSLDTFPRRQPVAETDHRKIVRKRSAQDRRPAEGRRHPRQDAQPDAVGQTAPQDAKKNVIAMITTTHELIDGEVYEVVTQQRSNAQGALIATTQKTLISRLSPTVESRVVSVDIYDQTSVSWTEYGQGSERIARQQLPTSNITAEQISWDGFITSQKDSAGITALHSRRYEEHGLRLMDTDGRGVGELLPADIAATRRPRSRILRNAPLK